MRHLKAEEVRGPTMPMAVGWEDHRSMKTVTRRLKFLII
jgi:hypothetical protein